LISDIDAISLDTELGDLGAMIFAGMLVDNIEFYEADHAGDSPTTTMVGQIDLVQVKVTAFLNGLSDNTDIDGGKTVKEYIQDLFEILYGDKGFINLITD